jgi:hypothetical protein
MIFLYLRQQVPLHICRLPADKSGVFSYLVIFRLHPIERQEGTKHVVLQGKAFGTRQIRLPNPRYGYCAEQNAHESLLPKLFSEIFSLRALLHLHEPITHDFGCPFDIIVDPSVAEDNTLPSKMIKT